MEEVIRRGRSYMDAGIDVFFPEGLLSREELERVSREVGAPLLYNRTGVSPNLPVNELQDLRIFIVANAGGVLRAAAKAMWDYLHAFAHEDADLEARIKDELKGHPVADFHSFVGFPDIRKLEEEYLPSEDLSRKYEGSIGFRP